MELFEEGGLKDQGNTKDPVSGNDVPVGSTKEEVRDDIPANLSEGEFVLPADVVRYHGLEKIMGIRDQAKQGLQKMEAMGQMGNSDQATIPDGVPFTEMAEGGAVPGLNIQKAQPQKTRPSMFQPPKVVQPPVVTPPVVGVPTKPVYASSKQTPQQTSTFQQAIGTPFGQQQQSETRVFVNDAGEKLYIPFVNGQPVYPIPAGYTQEAVAEKEKEQEQTVTDVRSRTTTDSDSDDVGIESTPVADIAREAQQKEKGLSKGLLQGIGALVNPIATIGGAIISNIMGKDKGPDFQSLDDEAADIAGAGIVSQDPAKIAEANSRKAFGTDIKTATTMFGATPTFKFGTDAGDVDRKSNGVYHASGLAMNADGSASLTKDGTVSYKSFDDFINHLAASHDTGWHGSTISEQEYKDMSQKGKDGYDAWASRLGYKTGGGTDSGPPPSAKDSKFDAKFQTGYEDFGTGTKTTTLTPEEALDEEEAFAPTQKFDTGKYLNQLSRGNKPSAGTKEDSRISTPKVDQFLELSPAVQRELNVGLARDPSLLRDPFENISPNKLASLKKAAKKTQDIYDAMYTGRKGAAISNIASQEYLDRNEEASQRGGDYGVDSSLYSNFGTVTPSYDSNTTSDDDGGQSSGGGSASSDMGFSTASGGFIQRKNLPKANKKKQGGLASRR